MKRRIKIGLIGTGGMGSTHLKCLLSPFEIEKAEVVAIADPHRESINNVLKILKTPVKVFSKYADLLELKDIEAVIIATPNDTHARIAIDALSAKKHVLCEKPMAITIKDCDAMIRSARQHNRILQIGLECRQYPLYIKTKKLLSENAVGKIRMMWCKEFRSPFLKKVDEWIVKPERSGNTLVEKNCHHFDLFNWMIASRPIKVCGFGGSEVIYEDTKAISNAWVVIEYENKARACLGLCMFTTHGDAALETGVIGESGKLENFFSEDKISLWRINPPKNTKYWHCEPKKKVYSIKLDPSMQPLDQREAGAVNFEHLNFLKCIKEEKNPEANGAVGRLSVAVALAAQKSIKENRAVYLSEICK